jgi:hypothetical protein
MQCDALLKRYIPGFDLNNLDDVCARESVDVTGSPSSVSIAFQFQQPALPNGSSSRPPLPPPGTQTPKGYPYNPGQMVPPVYPHPIPMYCPPYPVPPHLQIQPMFNPVIHPALQQHAPHQIPPGPMPTLSSSASPVTQDIKGQDPKANDMSNSQVQ